MSVSEPPTPVHDCHPFAVPTLNVFRQTAPAASRMTSARLEPNDAIRGSRFADAPPLNQVPHALPDTRAIQLELELSRATIYAALSFPQLTDGLPLMEPPPNAKPWNPVPGAYRPLHSALDESLPIT